MTLTLMDQSNNIETGRHCLSNSLSTNMIATSTSELSVPSASNQTAYYTAQTHLSTLSEPATSPEKVERDLPAEVLQFNETRCPLPIHEGSSSHLEVKSQKETISEISHIIPESSQESLPKSIQKKVIDEPEILPTESQDNVIEDTNDHEKLSFNELDHRPPYIPSSPVYSGFGQSSLRQSVITRQSTRLFPTTDNIRDHMEEQLVRWGAPQSAFKVDDILNGKHAFQKTDMPILDVSKGQESGNSDQTASVDHSITDSNVSSIAKSPYVTMEVSPEVTIRRSTFRESNIGIEDSENIPPAIVSPVKSDDSIQNSAYFNAKEYPDAYPAESASIRSQYISRINGGTLSDNHNVIEAITDNEQTVSVTTPNAYPLTEQDVPQLVKLSNAASGITVHSDDTNPNPATSFPTEQNIQDPNEQEVDEDIGCWTVTIEALNEMWNDFCGVVTCNGLPEDRYETDRAPTQ